MNKALGVIAVSSVIAMTACLDQTKKTDAPETKAAATLSLDTNISKVSYGIGLNIASNFKDQKIDIDKTAFQQGLSDGFEGADPKLDQQAIMEAMQTFQKEQMEKQLAEREAASTKNKADSDHFLEENAKKEGIKSTESGLQYEVVTEGTGAKPTADDTVTVQYRGTLTNGDEFDSSYSRGEPATFRVSNVIPGWTEALQMMPVGSKYKIYIPSNLAYGESGAGAKIGPNQALIFEVELLDIVKPEANKDAAAAAGG